MDAIHEDFLPHSPCYSIFFFFFFFVPRGHSKSLKIHTTSAQMGTGQSQEEGTRKSYNSLRCLARENFSNGTQPTRELAVVQDLG